MGRVISIGNHKGGVGKTTSVINIGAGLSKLGNKVLLIDLDPQANLTQSLGQPEQDQNIYGAIKGEYSLPILEINKRLFLVPSTLDLSDAELELSKRESWQYILRDLIKPYKGQYDYILIDTPPSLGLLTVNALTASQELIVPLQAQYLALRGIAKILDIVNMTNQELNKSLILSGVFITQYDKRKVLHREVDKAIREHFKDKAYKTKIRDNIALAEAPSRGVDIFTYQPKSHGAQDYLKLSREINKQEIKR